MKHHLILTILACFINYLPTAQAETLVTCSHPELCRMAQSIFAENQITNYQFVSSVKIVGDPHEYEPSTTEVKDLIKAQILVSGPLELNPWIKKVNYQRSKMSGLKTINVPMEKSEYAFYPGATHEALSHFWLYPKIFCALRSKLEDQFIALNMLAANTAKKTCSTEEQKIENELKATLISVKLPIVLTHDALLPLLESLSANKANVVAIKGSGHHQEATAKSVKKLYDALKSPKVIWINEAGINIPQNILSKKRSADQVIAIDTANSTGKGYFPILNELNEKLKALKP